MVREQKTSGPISEWCVVQEQSGHRTSPTWEFSSHVDTFLFADGRSEMVGLRPLDVTQTDRRMDVSNVFYGSPGHIAIFGEG
jgi:hypothetical protein